MKLSTREIELKREVRYSMSLLKDFSVNITDEIKANLESKKTIVQIENYRRSLIMERLAR